MPMIQGWLKAGVGRGVRILLEMLSFSFTEERKNTKNKKVMGWIRLQFANCTDSSCQVQDFEP